MSGDRRIVRDLSRLKNIGRLATARPRRQPSIEEMAKRYGLIPSAAPPRPSIYDAKAQYTWPDADYDAPEPWFMGSAHLSGPAQAIAWDERRFSGPSPPPAPNVAPCHLPDLLSSQEMEELAEAQLPDVAPELVSTEPVLEAAEDHPWHGEGQMTQELFDHAMGHAEDGGHLQEQPDALDMMTAAYDEQFGYEQPAAGLEQGPVDMYDPMAEVFQQFEEEPELDPQCLQFNPGYGPFQDAFEDPMGLEAIVQQTMPDQDPFGFQQPGMPDPYGMSMYGPMMPWPMPGL